MIFLTGVPGFLGTRLLRALAQAHPDADFGLLVQPKFEAKTHQVLDTHGLADRAEVLPGDITAPDLGLGARYDAVAERITMACHLAALYDLSVPRDLGWRVNVEGTRHVLDLLARSPNLARFGYVSTAYVSGRRTGTLYEDELVHNAGFKNFYEETKYHAEVLVQDRMDEIPTMIFRPGIVVGDSETGETEKFDGPYFVLRALRRLPRYTLMTRIGAGTGRGRTHRDRLSSHGPAAAHDAGDPRPVCLPPGQAGRLCLRAAGRGPHADEHGRRENPRHRPGARRLLRPPLPLRQLPHAGGAGGHRHRVPAPARLRAEDGRVHATPRRRALDGHVLMPFPRPNVGLLCERNGIPPRRYSSVTL